MLDILGKSAEKMLDLSDISLITQSKHTELVMKCTWKLIKAIPQMLQDQLLDIPPLLLDIHDFLVRTSPLEWKRRAALSIPQADMPLRTVKTILSMILNNIGKGYEAYITLIPDPANSYAVQYLKQMGDLTKKDKSLSGDEIKASLAIIFDKISNKEETKIGIQELYEFQKNHAYAHELIEDRLSQSGAYFQGYIRRGLNHLKESEASVSELVKPSSSFEKIGVSNTNSSFTRPVTLNISADGNNEVVHTFNQKEQNSGDDTILPAMDRSLAVAELKERLARMKLNMTK
jgi:cytoskeleton-associated protein 5